MKTRDRVNALRAALDRFSVDALLVTSLVNVRYLTGFTGSNGIMLLSRDEAHFYSDGRYKEQAAAEVSACEIHIVTQGRMLDTICEDINRRALSRLGVEADALTYTQYARLGEALTAERVPTTHAVEALRQVKDEDEIALLQQAAQLNDRVFAVACEALCPGVSEARITRIIRDAIEALGGDGVAFPTIVLFGERTSLPHGVPGDRQLNYGDLVLMDFGAEVQGYHGDMTRTVAFGEAPAQFAERYEAVLAAQQAVTARARPGMTGRELDAVARDSLNKAGYGEAFLHGTGHGVGLEIHEGPRVSATAEDPLPAGSVFTNEPGVYLPGWGGIRIEDMLVLRDDGAHRLTRAPLQLQVV